MEISRIPSISYWSFLVISTRGKGVQILRGVGLKVVGG